jgi:hypothetical protein
VATAAAATVSAMRGERFEVSVSFDSTQGYFTAGGELPQSLTALSLAACAVASRSRSCPTTTSSSCLNLDRAARLERDRRRLTGRPPPPGNTA